MRGQFVLTILLGIGTLSALPVQAQGAGMTVTAVDQTFVAKAGEGGEAEVALGQLAMRQGQNPEVRAFGARMVQDHGKANQQLSTTAKAMGMTPAASLSPKHQAVRDRLQALNGSAFDVAYMQAMVDDHRETVALFEKQVSQGGNAELVRLANETLPTLRSHLQAAETLLGQLKGS